MQTLRHSRLSVSAVRPKEWRFILSLVGDEAEDENDEGEGEVEETFAGTGKGVEGVKDLVNGKREQNGEEKDEGGDV